MQKIISRKNAYKTIALSLFAGLIIFYLFRTLVDVRDFIEIFRKANLFLILSVVAISFSVPILSTIRWQFILRLIGHNITFRQAFTTVMAVWPLSILPGRIGDFARSFPLRHQIRPAVTAGAVMFEKVIDVALLLFLSALGFLYLGSYAYSMILIALAIIIIPAFFLTRSMSKFLPESLSSKIYPLFTHLGLKDLKNKFFWLALMSSLANWWVSVLMIWLLYGAFGASISLMSASAYLPLAIFVGLLPISIAGLGTRDSALIAFFIDKATPAQSLAAGISYFLAGYLLFAILGIPFFIKKFFLYDRDV